MYNLPINLNEQILSNYKNLREFKKDCNIPGDLVVTINTVDGEYFIDTLLSFYYDENRFLDETIAIGDLPFSKYKDYGFDDAIVDYTDNVGRGGGDFINDAIAIINGVFNALNKYYSEKPINFEISILLLEKLIKALTELLKKFEFVDTILGVFRFKKNRKENLKASEIVNDYSNLSENEIKEINEGIDVLQKLYNDGVLEVAIREFIKNDEIRFEKYYKEKVKKENEQKHLG